MIWALDAEEVAFMVMVVGLKGLFALVCPMLNFNMSHESLECQSWDNAGQGDGHSILNCIGNKTVLMLSPQYGKHILANTDHDYVMNISKKR